MPVYRKSKERWRVVIFQNGKRRDFIVKYYDERIQVAGEAAVLYDLPSRVHETAPSGSD